MRWIEETSGPYTKTLLNGRDEVVGRVYRQGASQTSDQTRGVDVVALAPSGHWLDRWCACPATAVGWVEAVVK